MQALRADLSTFSAIRSAGAASSDRSRPTRASTTTPATFSGSAAPHSAAGPMFSMRWAALTPTFSPTWRRSTSAGACSWPVTGYGSCRRAGFTTSAAVRSRPIRRPKSSTTTAIIWRCSTSALRPCSGSRLPSCVLRSTCWRPCPIWCRGGATISGRCSAPTAISCGGTAICPASGRPSGRTAKGPRKRRFTEARWCRVIF